MAIENRRLTQTETNFSDNRSPLEFMIDILTSLWERVLLQSPIHPDENFFDLGGDSLIATSLVLEIEKETGRALPITTFYDAPTITAMAGILIDAICPNFSPLVLLKPGAVRTPLFIVAGLGGNVMELVQFGNRLKTDRVVYAIQARGLNGIDPPHNRVESMAGYYLDALRERQPHGPYLLAGYSFGGLVAFEMAHRLRDDGEEIALLAMIESYPHPIYLSRAINLRMWWILSSYHLAVMRRLPFGKAVRYGVGRCRTVLNRMLDRLFPVRGAVRKAAGASKPALLATLDRIREAGHQALFHYRPRFYPGKVTFFKAASAIRFPDNPTQVWRSFVQQLELHALPGDHWAVVRSEVEPLAACFSKVLNGLPEPLVAENDLSHNDFNKSRTGGVKSGAQRLRDVFESRGAPGRNAHPLGKENPV
jgi:acetoacetyl-CoA synthetase